MDFKKLLSAKLDVNTGMHGWLILFVGVYIGSLGFKMYRNTASGQSSMSMRQTVILMVFVFLAALFVIGYGVFLLKKGWQAEKRGTGGSDDGSKNENDVNQKEGE